MALTMLVSVVSAANTTMVPDTSKNIIDKTKIQYKLSEGKHKFYEHNYRGALNIYREVLDLDEGNTKAHYGIAECQYSLGKYKISKKHAEMAYKADPEVDKDVLYLLGNIYFRMNEIDNAIKHYEAFKASGINEKKMADYDVDLLINQCHYSKKMAQSPVDVTITNMGKNINTAAPEYAPSISPDGKMMVFTSRRADTKGGAVDINFDHQYYSDVYISEWNEDENDWGEAQNITGKVNTEYHDGSLGFMPTGELIIYRNIFGVTRSGDIYISKRSKSGKWGTPKPIMYKDKKLSKKINSTYFESSASMTADGNQIFFVSERPGGEGQADIYYIEKKGRTWSEPMTIGSTINTVSDEKCVFIHPNGKILFFTSNGYEESMGSYDVYYSVKNGTAWGKPVNMGYPINTVKEEKTISISADGKTAYIGAFYDVESKGGADIFKIDISKLGLPIE